MQVVTYATPVGPRSGIVLSGDRVLDLMSGGRHLPADHPLRAAGRWDLAGLLEAGVDLAALEDATRTGESTDDSEFLSLAELELLAPVPRPSKVVCIGLNTVGLVGAGVPPIREMPTAAPFWFYKAPSAVIGTNQPIIHPGRWHTERLIPEPELGLVIGRRCGPGVATPKAEEAHTYVAGYVVCNDVSGLDLEFDRGGDPFAFNLSWSKSYPTFAPIGPWMVTRDELDPTDLNVTLRVNDKTVVAANTRDYLWSPWELVEYFAAVMLMEPGDVISCGNFPPTEVIWPGDTVEIEVQGVGVLRNPVAAPAEETRYRVPNKATRYAREFSSLARARAAEASGQSPTRH